MNNVELEVENLPYSLELRPDLLEKVKKLSLDTLVEDQSQVGKALLKIKDTSGMSNPVYITSISSLEDNLQID